MYWVRIRGWLSSLFPVIMAFTLGTAVTDYINIFLIIWSSLEKGIIYTVLFVNSVN